MPLESVVAFSQNVSWSPHTRTASTGGIHDVGIDKSPKAPFSRSRCLLVRSWGSSATDRASSARTKKAHTVENRFIASGTQVSGSQWNGEVTRVNSGKYICGIHAWPVASATDCKFLN